MKPKQHYLQETTKHWVAGESVNSPSTSEGKVNTPVADQKLSAAKHSWQSWSPISGILALRI
jgi:hypothetical protein